MIFPVQLTLTNAAAAANAPQGIVEVLSNLLLNIVANPVSSLVNANYVGILTWAILLGLALRTANDTTKKVLADIADGTSLVVSWIINLAPFGIFGLVFNTVSTNGLDIFTTYGRLLLLLVGSMLFHLLCNKPSSGILVYPQESISADLPLSEEKCSDCFFHKKFCSQYPGQYESL